MEIREEHIQRVAYGTLAACGLGMIYVFQYTDFLFLASETHYSPQYHFVMNRAIRIFLNDLCMMALIYAIFFEKAVLRLALGIQLIDLFILFPLYSWVKLQTEGTTELSTPFLAQFHRLIVNPTLMILLIPALFYQRLIAARPKE